MKVMTIKTATMIATKTTKMAMEMKPKAMMKMTTEICYANAN
jgi:hypothetical protein